jgi:hypothetical protein
MARTAGRSRNPFGPWRSRRGGGGRGIRTPERVTPLTVFKTAGFNHSPIPPIPILPDFIRLRALSLLGSTWCWLDWHYFPPPALHASWPRRSCAPYRMVTTTVEWPYGFFTATISAPERSNRDARGMGQRVPRHSFKSCLFTGQRLPSINNICAPTTVIRASIGVDPPRLVRAWRWGWATRLCRRGQIPTTEASTGW